MSCCCDLTVFSGEKNVQNKRSSMDECVLGVVVIVLTFILLYWTKAPKRTMEHMVGRLATKFISNMLEQVREKIISDGYEHWKFDLYKKEFTLPELLSCHLTIKNLLVTGASKFVVNNVSYDVTTSRAVFDISVPKLFLGIGDINSKATVGAFFAEFEAELKGWITLMEPRITGAVVLEIDDEGNVAASSVDINVEVKDIQSKINLQFMDTDYSEMVNNFLREKLPGLINNYVNNCKGLIEAGLLSIANPILAQMF